MKRILFSIFLLAYLALIGSATMALQTSPGSAPGTKPDAQNTQVRSNGSKPTGEEVFKANCGRCHMPPMVVLSAHYRHCCHAHASTGSPFASG